MRLWATFATARRVLSMVCLFLASLRLLTVLIPIWFTGIVDPKHQMTYLHYLLKTYYLFRFQNQAEARTASWRRPPISCTTERFYYDDDQMITPQT